MDGLANQTTAQYLSTLPYVVSLMLAPSPTLDKLHDQLPMHFLEKEYARI